MGRTYLTLTLAALALAWLVFFGIGPGLSDCDAALLLGATGLFYWSFRTGQQPPPPQRWHMVALWALPVYAALQLIPLPQGILHFLSPARALFSDSLRGVIANVNRSPITVRPAFALFSLFALLGYLVTFNLLRDISWRFVEIRPWLPPAPVAAIAFLEAQPPELA